MRFNVCLYLSYHELHWSVREGFVAINLANISTSNQVSWVIRSIDYHILIIVIGLIGIAVGI